MPLAPGSCKAGHADFRAFIHLLSLGRHSKYSPRPCLMASHHDSGGGWALIRRHRGLLPCFRADYRLVTTGRIQKSAASLGVAMCIHNQHTMMHASRLMAFQY